MRITRQQVEIGEAISRIAMAWIAFLATLGVTGFFLGFFVWCVLYNQDTSAKIVVGLIDGFLLVLLRIVYKHVFPERTPQPQITDSSKDGETVDPE